eukprot:COSAG02_NODE_12967_length_1466_cov_1.869056_1_plen_462_part_10
MVLLGMAVICPLSGVAASAVDWAATRTASDEATEWASVECDRLGGTMGLGSETGAAGRLVCCPASCDGCGSGCEQQEGDSDECCADAILAAGVPCAARSGEGARPPCVLPKIGAGPSHRRRLGEPSPLDFTVQSSEFRVVAGEDNWFTIEVVDVDRVRVGVEAGLSAADFTTRSSLPSCRAFAGDLYDLLESLGLTPPCASSVIRFNPTAEDTPWLWNVTYSESVAGSYYMEIFFRDDPTDSEFDLGVRVGGRALQVIVDPAAAHPDTSHMYIPDVYVSKPAVAESTIFVTAFIQDEFGNPTDVGADDVAATIVHNQGAASTFLTGGNVTHQPRLFPGLSTPPRRSGFQAAGTLIPWDYDWALPQFGIFPIATPSLVTHAGDPNAWLFDDSNPPGITARPTNLVDQEFECSTLDCVTTNCFVGHCIANPDSMCAEEGISDFVRLDLESHYLVTSIFVAIKSL